MRSSAPILQAGGDRPVECVAKLCLALADVHRVEAGRPRFAHGLQFRHFLQEVCRGRIVLNRGIEPMVADQADHRHDILIALEVDAVAEAFECEFVGRGTAEHADGALRPGWRRQVSPRCKGIVIAMSDQHEAICVVRNRRGVFVFEVAPQFVTVENDVDGIARFDGFLEELRQLVPVGFHHDRRAAELFREIVGEFHFEADELAARVLIDVRSPAGGIGAPAQRLLLGEGRQRRQQQRGDPMLLQRETPPME